MTGPSPWPAQRASVVEEVAGHRGGVGVATGAALDEDGERHVALVPGDPDVVLPAVVAVLRRARLGPHRATRRAPQRVAVPEATTDAIIERICPTARPSSASGRDCGVCSVRTSTGAT